MQILYSLKTVNCEFEVNVFKNQRGFAVEMRDNEADRRVGDQLFIFESLDKAKKHAKHLLRHEDFEERRLDKNE